MGIGISKVDLLSIVGMEVILIYRWLHSPCAKQRAGSPRAGSPRNTQTKDLESQRMA
jgi:hypothetical protein